MMNVVYCFILTVILFLGTYHINSPKSDINSKNFQIPIIDKEKTFPMREYKPETDVFYVKLETNKEALLGGAARIFYVSDTTILVANKNRGEVFIFGIDGKMIKKFSVKGGLGVRLISYVVYDESNKEIFILDTTSRKIVVYNMQGNYLRTLRFPSDIIFVEISNFDNETLLAYHEHLYGPILQKQPYMLISKINGTVISKLNINLQKANSSVHIENSTWTRISTDHSGNCKFGNEFILANMSSDTIYLLKQDKTILPLFVQNPTVFSDPPKVVSVGMKTDEFITFAIYTFDVKSAARRETSGRFDTDARFVSYEFGTGRFYEHKSRGCWAEKAELPRNTGARFIYPFDLINKLKLGVLEGELKTIASNLRIDDNPIIKIIKVK